MGENNIRTAQIPETWQGLLPSFLKFQSYIKSLNRTQRSPPDDFTEKEKIFCDEYARRTLPPWVDKLSELIMLHYSGQRKRRMKMKESAGEMEDLEQQEYDDGYFWGVKLRLLAMAQEGAPGLARFRNGRETIAELSLTLMHSVSCKDTKYLVQFFRGFAQGVASSPFDEDTGRPTMTPTDFPILEQIFWGYFWGFRWKSRSDLYSWLEVIFKGNKNTLGDFKRVEKICQRHGIKLKLHKGAPKRATISDR